MEQLYPFPEQQIARELDRYPYLKEVIWCQEEARNQGAWSFVVERLQGIVEDPLVLRYVGPEAAASTAPGYASMHAARQESTLHEAIDA